MMEYLEKHNTDPKPLAGLKPWDSKHGDALPGGVDGLSQIEASSTDDRTTQHPIANNKKNNLAP
jgi:hypothetical protein